MAAAAVKKVQWGTKIEVKTCPRTKSPSDGNIQASVDFSMLYLKQQQVGSDDIDLPTKLVVHYTDDYNILEADLIIRKRFELRRSRSIDKILSQICTENLKLSQPQSVVQRKATEANKEKLEKELSRLRNDEDKEDYILRTNQLIEEYRKLGVKHRVINFSQQREAVCNPTFSKDDELRRTIVMRYLEIARDYIEVVLVLENDANSGDYCGSCGSQLEEILMDEVGIRRCPGCGIEQNMLLRNHIVIDPDNDTVSRGNYDDRNMFYQRLLRFQGKQTGRLPLPAIMKDLDNYFTKMGLPTGEEVRKRPTLPNGTKEGTSSALMIRALHDTGHADHYEDRNLIMHEYWAWVLPDISHLEEQIMRDYDATQKVFERMKTRKRSSINGEYRQFKHLQLVGYNCDESMFRIIKTRETLEQTESTWKSMCEGAGLRFIPTI